MNGGINIPNNHNGNLSGVGLSLGLGSSLKIDINSIQQNSMSTGNTAMNGSPAPLSASGQTPTPLSGGIPIPNSPPPSGLASPTKSPTSSVPVSPRSGQQVFKNMLSLDVI